MTWRKRDLNGKTRAYRRIRASSTRAAVKSCSLEFSKNKDIQALQLVSLRWHCGRV